jgi:hypothetical protein
MIGAMAQKNPAAVALGRLGGQAKVPKGFSALSDEDRKSNAKRAAQARWGLKTTARVAKRKAKR